MEMPNVKSNHIGKKIERIRELRGIKQDTLATALGISQQAVSKMEKSDEIDEDKLGRVAAILGVSTDSIKNFSEENAIFNVQNNYDNATLNVNYQVHPIDKLVELFEENKKLYERLLESERKRNEQLESMLKKQGKTK